MKTKILIILLSSLTFFGCEDFLDLKPQTFVSSATFFQTEEDFQQALSGAYESLRGIYEEGYVMGEMRSDNTHMSYNPSDRADRNVHKENIANFVNTPLNVYAESKYTACYEGISRCNAILDRIESSSLSDEAKDVIGGQAKFLRAFYYFELVQYFGGVPLHLREVTTEEEAYLPRSSKADVYDQIIKDASAAAEELPVSHDEKGRAAKGAAYTLLGYVYMTLKDYPKAEEALKEVTTLGYSLMPDYADIFSTANKNNEESIFEVQYMQGNQGQNSNWTYKFIPRLEDTSIITGVAGNNTTDGGWNQPTDDLINAYEPGDLRKDASLAEGYTDQDGNYVADPFITKYLNSHASFNNTDDNWIVYRYADVLLLLAECLNEQNKPGEALGYINGVFGATSIRGRAGLPDITETDQDLLREIIAHERRVELAFENHRWLDLVRTGKAIEVMNAYGEALKDQYSYLLSSTYNVTEDKLVFPIPQNEVILNEKLRNDPD